MSPVVRRIFTLRSEGQSVGKIAAATGVKYSTVLTILNSRIYLGEVPDERSGSPRCSPPPTGGGSRDGLWAPTSSRAGSAAGCAAGSWPSTRMARAAGTTVAATAARAAPNRAGAMSACFVPPCWGCGSSATTRCWGPPFARSSIGPERRPTRPAEGLRNRRSRHGVEDLEAQRRRLLRLYYDDKMSYNRNLWMHHLTGGAAYLPL